MRCIILTNRLHDGMLLSLGLLMNCWDAAIPIVFSLRIFAASMRRPVLVKYTSPVSSFEPLFGADQREAHYCSSPRDFRPPFPLISLPAFGPGGSCQGRACFWRGLRTLDNFH